jgi:hypothetical protein
LRNLCFFEIQPRMLLGCDCDGEWELLSASETVIPKYISYVFVFLPALSFLFHPVCSS